MLLLLIAQPASADPGANAADIARRAYELDSGTDMLAELHFTFLREGGRPSNLEMLMAYKAYGGEHGLHSKIIMFNEFPPDRKDISFLGYLYTTDTGREDDMWLYLPELRSIRKLSHHAHAHEHGHGENDDSFKESVLDRIELDPRDPRLDHHQLLGIERIGDNEYYHVESRPLDANTSPYGSIQRWYSTADLTPVRSHFFDIDGRLRKTLEIEWAQMDGAWVWHKVTATDTDSGDKTVLEQRRIKINQGLSDTLFSKRMMRKGASALRNALPE